MSVCASAGSIPAALTARRYLETAPTERSRARASARTLKLLVCSPISCFNFDMEILSFGIDRAPRGQKSPDYAVGFAINLQSSAPSFHNRERESMNVNTFPPS